MTREEAIKRLKEYAQYSYGIWHNDEEDTKAFDMAIEALQAEYIIPSGEVVFTIEVVLCKDCRHAEHREQMPNQVYCKRDKLSTFCAVHDDDDFCKWGARMKGGAE